MNRYKLTLAVATILTLIGWYGCKEKYRPEIKDNNVKYLVIEGLINTGADSTIFTLSRTFKLDNLLGPTTRFTPIYEVWIAGNLVGYPVTDLLYCVDCRTQGGTNRRPSYWR